MAALFQLVGNRPSPQPGQQVLKAREAMTFFEAEELVTALQARTRDLDASAETIYRQRHEDGYRDGLQAGKMEYAGKILETVMSSVEYLENLEVSLVRIVGEITRKLLGEMEHDEVIVRLVRQALHAVRSERKVMVRVSVKDETAVRQGLAGLLQQKDGGAAGFLEIVPDPDLLPGSCILESEMGVIEASLEAQLKNLEDALLKRVRKGGGGAGHGA
jgi:type III secretion protein L